jgi:hypothetical protein
MPCRAKQFVGDLSTVKRLHAVTGRVAEGNHFSGATLVRHGGGFPPHRDAGLFQPRRQGIERRRVRGLPAEKTLSVGPPAIDN